MALQRTLKKSVSLSGVGLHSGEVVDVTLKPAEPNSGIRFFRTDLTSRPEIKAHFSNVKDTTMATTLGEGQALIGTVEHLMAALRGMGVDNLSVEVNGPEVPVLDGSSVHFCEAIQGAGIEFQLQPRPTLVLRKKVEVKLGENRWAMVEPHSGFELHSWIRWDHPVIGAQTFSYVEGKTSFIEIAPARTFGFLHEVEMLKSKGLAKGGSLENAVVLNQRSVINPEGLRFDDEFVRHKVLDSLGDIALAGSFSIQGKFQFRCSGHELHYRLLNAIFASKDNYEIVTIPVEEESEEEIPSLAASRVVAV